MFNVQTAKLFNQAIDKVYTENGFWDDLGDKEHSVYSAEGFNEVDVPEEALALLPTFCTEFKDFEDWWKTALEDSYDDEVLNELHDYFKKDYEEAQAGEDFCVDVEEFCNKHDLDADKYYDAYIGYASLIKLSNGHIMIVYDESEMLSDDDDEVSEAVVNEFERLKVEAGIDD